MSLPSANETDSFEHRRVDREFKTLTEERRKTPRERHKNWTTSFSLRGVVCETLHNPANRKTKIRTNEHRRSHAHGQIQCCVHIRSHISTTARPNAYTLRLCKRTGSNAPDFMGMRACTRSAKRHWYWHDSMQAIRSNVFTLVCGSTFPCLPGVRVFVRVYC